MATKQTFSKNERLCSKTIIDRLFEKGSTLTQAYYLFPFKVFYFHDPSMELVPTQVMFTVPKRFFKKAVNRNLIRRRCRESYRKNKYLLYHHSQAPSYIAFVYIAKEIMDYNKIDKSINTLLPNLKIR